MPGPKAQEVVGSKSDILLELAEELLGKRELSKIDERWSISRQEHAGSTIERVEATYTFKLLNGEFMSIYVVYDRANDAIEATDVTSNIENLLSA